jgi:hypothetical protein
MPRYPILLDHKKSQQLADNGQLTIREVLTLFAEKAAGETESVKQWSICSSLLLSLYGSGQ